MEENVKLTNDIVKAVYAHISKRYSIDNVQVFEFITKQANINNQSREQYILYYYENIKLKDNKSDAIDVEDIDKVNFEELTETDKKVIASRKCMCHEYVKEIVYKLNELINKDLSNDRHAVDDAGVITYAIQAIYRDVANAVSDYQKVLKLMKSKCS